MAVRTPGALLLHSSCTTPGGDGHARGSALLQGPTSALSWGYGHPRPLQEEPGWGGDAAGGIFSAPSPSTAAHCMATAEFSRTQHWEGCHF